MFAARPRSSSSRRTCPRPSPEGTGFFVRRVCHLRHIGLGRADGRYFTFCAGLGIDADVIRTVERARLRGKVSGPGLYIRSTLARLLLDTARRTPTITLDRAGERPDPDIATAIVHARNVRRANMAFRLSMILSDNRFPFFGIML